ncbi:hypothetical protein EVA_19288 [gut metagenome]|uniref:Uncharacterized protein n=1 Tax=gut metagenome TaxID=749906 RepID=J9FST1_9ZZZZ
MRYYLLEERELAKLFKCAVRQAVEESRRMDNPKRDLLSMNEAYREFGRRWVESKLAQGAVTAVRLGESKNSKRCVSRADLSALVSAELADRAARRYVAETGHAVERLSTGAPVLRRDDSGSYYELEA